MDFSHAGYGGGGVRIPSPPVAVRLTAVKRDNTARIQAALDEAGKKAPAAVLMAAGEYEVAGTVSIAASGVVLRGESGTIVRLTGPPHRFLEIHGTGTYRTDGAAATIAEDYAPVGADTFRVENAAAFHAGDRVLIQRPVTAEWVHRMGMDALVRDGKPQT